MRLNNTLPFAAALLLAALAAQSAPAGEPDKSRYTLFNPTPAAEMREMSTDRPDKTESPYTVDAGHFQVEADMFSHGYDRYHEARDGSRTETFSYGTVNLKAGLLNDLDLQLVFPTYSRTVTRAPGTSPARVSGSGDLTARLKWNLWGNDGGKTALALMPHVTFPTAQHGVGSGGFEGGLIVPLAIELPGSFGLGLMSETDAVRNETRSGYHAEFVHTITLSRDLVGKLGGYLEFFSLVSTGSNSPWVGTFDIGFTYPITPNLQVDAGVNLGLTRSAEDVNPFVGISWRY